MHAEWLYLSPLFSSITFTSFCSACPSLLFFFCRQLKGLQRDFVKCLCERFSACCLAPLCPPSTLFQRPPQCCNTTVEKIHCSRLWLCLIVYVRRGNCIHWGQTLQHFHARGKYISVPLFTFFLSWVDLVGVLTPEARVFITTTKCHKRSFLLISEAIDPRNRAITSSYIKDFLSWQLIWR